MKKSFFVMAVAAMFAFATVSSCGDSKSKKEKDEDTEEVDEDDEADNYVTVEVDYMSDDLATFDLLSDVQAVEYSGDEHSSVYYFVFDDKGALLHALKVGPDNQGEEAVVDRDRKGRIISLAWESDEPWMTSFGYPENTGISVPNMYMSTNQMGNYTCETYHRDADGKLLSVDYEEAVHGNVVEGQPPVTINLFDADLYGNWQKMTFVQGDYSYNIKRKIYYTYDGFVLPVSIASADDEQAICSFLTDMYENGRYNDWDFLEAHCTPRLLQHLKDSYEYDGEGYAGWLFRTGAQDGKPGVDDAKSQIITVSKNDDGWYSYKFLDEGWRGVNRVKCFIENGTVMMDELERVYDETIEAYQ